MTFEIPKELRWVPPTVPAMSEPERRAYQAKLEAFKVLGRAIDADFSVEEELHRRGLRTNAEVEAEARAERARALQGQVEAAVNATFDQADERFK